MYVYLFITKFQSNIYTYIYTYKLLLVIKSITIYIHIYETRIRRRLGLLLPSPLGVIVNVYNKGYKDC